eukprot:CAMPEP_0178386934 /NCGR_PEP_ID=MMETSP0689_2-20121128/8818_1 /TAXON_ID=160604 /ORGANISM="Amphidinium massartii, Strain CS-259" /LENGTH=420 /DNA_ID=CAMNT_0020007291 /DNA_START=168 /DNA_END=1427 /DNA_ORIENTATION=-
MGEMETETLWTEKPQLPRTLAPLWRRPPHHSHSRQMGKLVEIPDTWEILTPKASPSTSSTSPATGSNQTARPSALRRSPRRYQAPPPTLPAQPLGGVASCKRLRALRKAVRGELARLPTAALGVQEEVNMAPCKRVAASILKEIPPPHQEESSGGDWERIIFQVSGQEVQRWRQEELLKASMDASGNRQMRRFGDKSVRMSLSCSRARLRTGTSTRRNTRASTRAGMSRRGSVATDLGVDMTKLASSRVSLLEQQYRAAFSRLSSAGRIARASLSKALFLCGYMHPEGQWITQVYEQITLIPSLAHEDYLTFMRNYDAKVREAWTSSYEEATGAGTDPEAPSRLSLPRIADILEKSFGLHALPVQFLIEDCLEKVNAQQLDSLDMSEYTQLMEAFSSSYLHTEQERLELEDLFNRFDSGH